MYGGGYYKIENLPDPENNQILDLYILIQDVSKFEDMNYLKDLFVQAESNAPTPRTRNMGQNKISSYDSSMRNSVISGDSIKLKEDKPSAGNK
jgi:hypothetical protein